MSDDPQLIRTCLDGDASAFGALVERYWGMVVALALSRISDPAEAEDVAQESFLKAYAQLHTLRDPARFAGWLSKIALQQCVNAVRRDVRRQTALGSRVGSSDALDAIPAYSSNPGLTESQIRLVQNTVGRLPEKFQRLIVLRFVANLSSVQIAAQLGKRPGTIRVWLHRAYKILRRDLAPVLEEVRS